MVLHLFSIIDRKQCMLIRLTWIPRLSEVYASPRMPMQRHYSTTGQTLDSRLDGELDAVARREVFQVRLSVALTDI